jgi:hypothetical protein
MTDSLQLYCTPLTAFCQLVPRGIFGDVRRLMVLAWAVVGLCLTKTVNFNLWGEVVHSRAQYASSTRRWVDTHWERGMSYLNIGWQWLRQQFRRGWPVLAPFGLEPGPDPEPACASRRQAEQPKRKWVVACFGAP